MVRSDALRRILALTLLAVTACSARSSLDEDARGPSTMGSGGAGGSEGTAGGGGTSGAFSCPNLVWAGAPLHVPFVPGGPYAKAPRLIAIDAKTYVVTATGETDLQGAGQDLASFVVHDPFGAWPPSAGPVDVVLPAPSGVVATQGDPGQFAFALIDATSNFVLGETVPGGAWSALDQYPSVPGPLPFVSRSTDGAYLVGGESDSQLSLLVFPAPKSGGTESILSGPGCATSGTRSAAAPGVPGAFLVASSVGDGGGCGPTDPPSPPDNIAITRVTVSPASATQTGLVPTTGVVSALELAARSGGGAWLGFAGTEAAAPVYRVLALDDQGAFVGGPAVELVDDPPAGATPQIDYDLASIGDTFAVARTARDGAGGPGGALLLSVYDEPQLITIDLGVLGAGTSPASAPAIATSTNARSILVAFYEGDAGPLPLFTLLRADCVETP